MYEKSAKFEEYCLPVHYFSAIVSILTYSDKYLEQFCLISNKTIGTLNFSKKKKHGDNSPPSRSENIFTDTRYFLLHKPRKPTLVRFHSDAERHNYSQRIIQRLGIDVNKYAILNIHKIGIDAPASYVFEDLLQWNGDSTCWPNHIAKVFRVKGRLENIKIFLFGYLKNPLKSLLHKYNYLGVTLFDLTAMKIVRVPEKSDVDNARYFLYRCSGGYPIGVFSMYVRSSIGAQQEKEQSQLFMIVGFNFYGRESWSHKSWINSLWESVHDRVSANTLNRVKQLCEWRFQDIQAG
ncbi:MAG: hypothetical protein DWQ05_21645 [Calditrichaeota bacterium]|nr:MAG: hypothetical protein DWQ05_21645 [Calditrichota bacterium]